MSLAPVPPLPSAGQVSPASSSSRASSLTLASAVPSDASVPSSLQAPVREVIASHHIRLTSHVGGQGALPISWAADTAAERGPVVGTTTNRSRRNVIGTHSGSYSIYRALAVASGALSAKHKADLTNTSPTDVIGPYPQWSERKLLK